MSRQTIRPGLKAASGDERPGPTSEPQPSPTPWPDPAPIRVPSPMGPGPRVAPPPDLDDERWQDAQRFGFPSARVIDRDPQRPGTYTVLLDRCLCGAVVGECDCPSLGATLPAVPVYTIPARPQHAYRVEFEHVTGVRRVPPLTTTADSDAELAIAIDRYVRPFFGRAIEVALSIEIGIGNVWDGVVPAGRFTVATVTR